jgi:predicted DNA-binding protein
MTTTETKPTRGGKRAGAGAPLSGSGPSIPLNIRLSDKQADDLNTLAAAKGVPAAEIIRSALSAYLTAEETTELLKPVPAMRQRLESEEMISVLQAAELMGVTVPLVNSWCRKGTAIGLKLAGCGNSYRLPSWQFTGTMWEIMPTLAKLSNTSGWNLLNLIETPAGAAQGLTIRQLIEQGRVDDAKRIAEAYGH